MKTQIAAAIALSLVAGVTSQHLRFYGEIDVTANYLPEDNASPNKGRDVVELNSNNSFLGLKGEEKLTDRLNALYQAEFTLYVDNGGSTDIFVPRNLLVGLQDQETGYIESR